MGLALWVEPGDGVAAPGGTVAFTLRVANQGQIVDRIRFEVLGPAASWAVVEPAEVSLFPGGDASATLTLSPPPATEAGPVPFGVRATGEASGDVEVGEATLTVGASRTVEAALRPRTATGKRRATSVVVLHNTGNAGTDVRLVPSDPDEAIVFAAPEGVQVAPGETVELPLRMRLPGRPRQGATLPYLVLVQADGTDQSSLDGQVRQPPRRMWPIAAALLVAALAVVAFSRLRPEDSVALLPASQTGDSAGTAATALPGDSTSVPVTGASSVPDGGGTTTSATGPPVDGATTSTGPVPNSTTTGPPPSIPVPTTATTIRRLSCPAKGDAKATAQRVVCAWELRRLSEAADSVTPETAAALEPVPPAGSGSTGQRAVGQVSDATGTTITFDRCGNGRGVVEVRVASTAPNAGMVVGFRRCPAAAG